MARVSEARYVRTISNDKDTDEDDIEELEDALGRVRHLRHELMDALHQGRRELFFDRSDAFAREDTPDRDLFFLLVGRRGKRKHFCDKIIESGKDQRIDRQCQIYIFYLIKHDEKHGPQRQDSQFISEIFLYAFVMPDDKNHKRDDPQMHHPMHREDREEDRSSSYRQSDHQDKKGREIKSHLKHQGSVFVVSEDRSHPE